MTTVNIVSMLKGLREAGCRITTICKCKGYRGRLAVARKVIIGERSEPLSRVFNDKPRDIYGGVRTYVQNASCYFSKLKLRSHRL